MRDVPILPEAPTRPIPAGDYSITGIPLLEDGFDEEDAVVEDNDLPRHDFETPFPITLK